METSGKTCDKAGVNYGLTMEAFMKEASRTTNLMVPSSSSKTNQASGNTSSVKMISVSDCQPDLSMTDNMKSTKRRKRKSSPRRSPNGKS